MSNTAVQFSIDADLAERLQRLAEERDVSPSVLLEGLLADGLDDAENEAEWDRRAIEALEAYDRDGIHLTHAEVIAELRLRVAAIDAGEPVVDGDEAHAHLTTFASQLNNSRS